MTRWHAEAMARATRDRWTHRLEGAAICLLIVAFIWFTHDVLDRLDATLAQGAAMYCAPGC